jgi:hypothetical protein
MRTIVVATLLLAACNGPRFKHTIETPATSQEMARLETEVERLRQRVDAQEAAPR